MSVHSALHLNCVACDTQVPMLEARNKWWICTICGSYICPNCRALFLETGQVTCPGSIVRGSESHSPHFTRFLAPRQGSQEQENEPTATVVILADVPRQKPRVPSGKVIILTDEERETNDADESGDNNVD
ncbi:MAG: hypothetical protein ACFFD8_09085 [Candidatus Thorarchaeota archaeon]